MADTEALEAEVATAARALGLAPGDGVLVACSGGADSTALAALLSAARGQGLPLRLVLGHVDHGWRGPAEAAADLAVCAGLAAALGAPLRTALPPAVVRRTEDDARRHRYAALARLAAEDGCPHVAVAHHRRDQAETVLLRLRRGSGPAGLAGIPARRPLAGGPTQVVRPLLDVDPARLRAYLVARGLRWRDDPTNAAVDRDRARVRARLVAAEARGSALGRDLAATAARLRRALERREAEVAGRCAASMRVHPVADAVEVALADVAGLAPAQTATLLRVLGAALAADADGPWFARVHVALVARLVAEGADGAAVPLPRGRSVRRHGRRLVLAGPAARPFAALSLDGDGEARSAVGPWRVTLSRRTVPATALDLAAWAAAHRATPHEDAASAALDADVLGPKLVLRAVREDDRFVPLGRRRARPAADFLARQGVPGPVRRGALAVATPGGAVAWLVGARVDAASAVGRHTRAVALVSVRVERV